MKFRKKPVVVEAVQFQPGEQLPIWTATPNGNVKVTRDGSYLEIETLEGVMRANPGDWIIKGVKGELYPRKPDIFEATYEPVEEVRERAAKAKEG